MRGGGREVRGMWGVQEGWRRRGEGWRKGGGAVIDEKSCIFDIPGKIFKRNFCK